MPDHARRNEKLDADTAARVVSYKPTHKADAPDFDDDSEPVAVTSFSFPDEDSSEADDVFRVRRETIIRLLQFITAGKREPAKTVGARVLLLAFLAGASDCKTQSELAKRLGITQSGVSRALISAKKDFSMLARGS